MLLYPMELRFRTDKLIQGEGKVQTKIKIMKLEIKGKEFPNLVKEQ